MNNKETGGTAFPGKRRIYRAGYATDQFEPVDGMTLRDYFAAKAMQGLIASDIQCGPNEVPVIAKSAYAMADAMLEARK